MVPLVIILVAFGIAFDVAFDFKGGESKQSKLFQMPADVLDVLVKTHQRVSASRTRVGRGACGRSFAQGRRRIELLLGRAGQVLAAQVLSELRGRREVPLALEGAGPCPPVVLLDVCLPETAAVEVGVRLDAGWEEACIRA